MIAIAPFADAFRRLLAAGAAALVLTLIVLAASPEAHEHVHHDCHHDEEHTCAVVLFAQGLWTSLDIVAATTPEIAWAQLIPLYRPPQPRPTPTQPQPPPCGPPIF